MRRNEILWPSATRRIPAERMKMRKPHDVPLSTQALKVLRDAWSFTMEDNLVFPSIRSLRRPLSENAFNSVLRRLGYGQDEHCAHGFRSSASTILNEREYDLRVIEVALAHQDENKVRAVYNRDLNFGMKGWLFYKVGQTCSIRSRLRTIRPVPRERAFCISLGPIAPSQHSRLLAQNHKLVRTLRNREVEHSVGRSEFAQSGYHLF